MSTRSNWLTRAETSADIPAVHEITLAAFETSYEADLVDALRTDSSWIDGLSIVATDQTDTLTGYVLLTRGHVGDIPVLCLGPCAVLPAHQRTGVGSALVRAALRAAKSRGEFFVILLGHPGYYPRFGFGRASEHGLGLSIDAADEAFMALTLDAGHPLPSGTVRWAAPFGI
jgi:putative acetyltransferase